MFCVAEVEEELVVELVDFFVVEDYAVAGDDVLFFEFFYSVDDCVC